MKRVLKTLGYWGMFACSTIATTACQTAPGARFTGLEQVDSGMGDIYIYKNDSIKIQKRFSVKVGDGPAEYLYNASYLFYRLKPGSYEIVVSPGPMLINSRLNIEVKAGARGFYEYSTVPTPFVIDFAIGSSLDERTPEIAAKDLPKLFAARVKDSEKDSFYETSNFAKLSDVDAVPKLNEAGRGGYRQWLTKILPRAFVIAEDGAWVATWNVFPADTSESKYPLIRAIQRCEKHGHKLCKPYAIDKRVVWIPSSK